MALRQQIPACLRAMNGHEKNKRSCKHSDGSLFLWSIEWDSQSARQKLYMKDA